VRAALKALRKAGAGRIVLAVPVAPADSLDAIGAEADRVICLSTPEPFHAVGLHYADFEQTTDEEVIRLLAEADRIRAEGRAGAARAEGR
jgi:putative phosphoribosyl transferase